MMYNPLKSMIIFDFVISEGIKRFRIEKKIINPQNKKT